MQKVELILLGKDKVSFSVGRVACSRRKSAKERNIVIQSESPPRFFASLENDSGGDSAKDLRTEREMIEIKGKSKSLVGDGALDIPIQT